jgi:hypothetical protein
MPCIHEPSRARRTLEPARRHEPASGTVTAGLATRHRLVFVPSAGAVFGPVYLKVTYAGAR